MLAQVLSAAVLGVDAYLVRVEVDLANGLPSITVVGLPEGAVREGRERVTAAIKNSGFQVPTNRITINLAPADIRKEGSAFDLPIAVGLLGGTGIVPAERFENTCFVGELGLDGELRPVRGALPLALRCRHEGVRTLVLPAANAREAAVAEGVRVLPAGALGEVVAHLRGDAEILQTRVDATELFSGAQAAHDVDLADVRGQQHAKRALEVAAAGSHNLMKSNPTCLARQPPCVVRCEGRIGPRSGVYGRYGSRLQLHQI